MKTICPEYFKDFVCIASSCPDTCCAGWEIVIDEKFQKLYKESSAPAAKDAVKAMYTDDDGDVVLKLNNGRCPMLDRNNLCRLYTDMGKDAICDVCRVFPRFNKDYKNFLFSGISLSCPEAAKLILSDKSNGGLNTEPVFKTQAENKIFDIYKTGEFLKDIPPSDVMLEITNIMLDFEILTDEWHKMCLSLKKHLEKACSDIEFNKKRDASFKEASQLKEIKNIKKYYLFKYLAEALDIGDTSELIRTASVCTAVISEMYAFEIKKSSELCFEKKLRIAELFSKEIEHCEENLNSIVYQTPQLL